VILTLICDAAAPLCRITLPSKVLTQTHLLPVSRPVVAAGAGGSASAPQSYTTHAVLCVTFGSGEVLIYDARSGQLLHWLFGAPALNAAALPAQEVKVVHEFLKEKRFAGAESASPALVPILALSWLEQQRTEMAVVSTRSAEHGVISRWSVIDQRFTVETQQTAAYGYHFGSGHNQYHTRPVPTGVTSTQLRSLLLRVETPRAKPQSKYLGQPPVFPASVLLLGLLCSLPVPFRLCRAASLLISRLCVTSGCGQWQTFEAVQCR
jgi:hypothetical protein